jgi:ferrous iron transport protein B
MNAVEAQVTRSLRVALMGNPNTGKTTLFNRLCGVRHKTGNFPGTTQEARLGSARAAGRPGGEPDDVLEIVDLPGVYGLELDAPESSVARGVLAGTIAPAGERAAAPHAVCVVIDATNLSRNLVLVGEVLRRRLPTVVVLNMMDLARSRGLSINVEALADILGCRVMCTNARKGEGVEALPAALAAAVAPTRTVPGTQDALEAWADDAYARVASHADRAPSRWDATDRIDRFVTHPVLGLATFVAVATGLFYVIFSLAGYPRGWIETIFGGLGTWVEGVMPEGILRDFLVGGVIGGVGSTVVFLPQICLLFFLISLLEDTGYLARAAFVMDRWLRPFGLPGHSFMPLLSSHACALPGIMSARGVPDRRDRLATILVAPFMSCSARIPVYVLLTGLLFPDSPGKQALAFTGCYALGIAAGLLSALVARRTILRGKSRPMALELPTYKRPSLRTAGFASFDRGVVFIKKAGSLILAISIVLWWLSSYPKVEAPEQAVALRAQAAALVTPVPTGPATDGVTAPEAGTADVTAQAAELEAQAAEIEARWSLRQSFAGRLGSLIQPIFAPLGYDWQLSIGVMTSFAAREVFVTTMGVIVAGTDDTEAEGFAERIAGAKRDDGITPLLPPAVAWSLLVYYVLAMQCLPTLAVTAREAGSSRWALIQLAWMCGLAYVGGLIAYQLLR